MARWVILLVACGLVSLSGCIQIEVPTAPTGAGTSYPTAPAAEPADKYPVTCVLMDDAGTPVEGGSCDYRFGSLGGVVEVDENGTAVRLVPTGATGTVTGTAPGHAGAKATLTVTGPKTVRMTLPELKAKGGSAPPPAHGEPAPPEDNRTVVAENQTEDLEVVYDPVFDTLLKESYSMAPPVPDTTYTITVARPYDLLEFSGRYAVPGGAAWAIYADVTVTGPDGSEVLHYQGLPDAYAYFYFGGSTVNFPIGVLADPPEGTYTVTVTAAGTATAFDLVATGQAGGAPDIPFLDVMDGTTRNLRDYRGKAVVIDLMATWCPPCQDAMPHLKAIRADYGDAIEIISIDIDSEETEGDLRGFRSEYGGTWVFGLDSEGLADQHYSTGFIPSYAVIDVHGNLLVRDVSMSESELREWLDRALQS